MEDHAFEVQRADEDIEIGETVFPEGSYVVRMDQPFSRGADMLLDKQYYNPDDPSPYDDVGWTVGPLFNAQTVRVEDTAILDAEMTLVESVAVAGGVDGRRGGTYLVNYNADNTLAAFRFAHPDLVVHAAEASFTDDDREFNAGTFVIREADHPEMDLGAVLEQAGAEYGFTARRTRSEPEVALHETRIPRIAVLHTWTNTQDEGWLRMGLDEYGVSHDYISVHDVRDNAQLRETYDVIVMGQQRGGAMSLVRGPAGRRSHSVEGHRDHPQHRTAGLDRRHARRTRAGGRAASQGIRRSGRGLRRPGRGLEPADPLRLADGVSIRQTPGMWARGGVFATRVADDTSPIAYGYDDLGVAFNTAPVFRIGGGGGGFAAFFGGGGGAQNRGSGDTTARRTGRGGADEDDLVQGRARDLGVAGVEAFRADQDEDDAPAGGGFSFGPNTDHIRVVMRFARRADDLLISGGLKNGQALANAPAVVDVPLGDGHVVLFSFNPFWRSHTHGSYALLFNTLMHHDALSGPPEAMTAEEEAEEGRPGRR